MIIDFAEILEDLELKRAAAVPAADRPGIDVAAALAGLELEGPDLALAGEDGGEQPFAPPLAAAIVADAVATLGLAGGESDVDTAAARAIVRAVTADVVQRLATAAGSGARAMTVHDLSTLVEAALIAAGYYDVAKALVLRRALPPARGARAAGELRLIRRSGEVAAWSTAKIEVAIRKAFLSLAIDSEPAVALAERVSERAHALGMAYVPIEAVQDLVQEELVLAGHMRVAERYIVYRAERAMLRAQQANDAPAPAPVPVLEADGGETPWTGEDLRARIAFASIGLDLDLGADELERELRRSIRPGVAREDLRRLVILNARTLVERDAELTRFAGRILLSYVYEETLGCDIAGGSTPACWTTTPAGSRPGWTRPPTWTSTSSACRRCMTATCSSTRPASARAGSRRRSCSGCAWRWACAWPSAATSARIARSPSTGCTSSAGSAPPRPRCSTPAPLTRSCRPATSTRSRTRWRPSWAGAWPRTRCAPSGRAAWAARGPRCGAPARTSSPRTARARASCRS
jgi:hypothetical protein